MGRQGDTEKSISQVHLSPCLPISSSPCLSSMLDLLDQVLQRTDDGELLAICTLVAARGSTPQNPPAMMVVLSNGQTIGTIGGGCVEAEVKTRALRRLADTSGTPTAATVSA